MTTSSKCLLQFLVPKPQHEFNMPPGNNRNDQLHPIPSYNFSLLPLHRYHLSSHFLCLCVVLLAECHYINALLKHKRLHSVDRSHDIGKQTQPEPTT